jgi:hypothetical protein
MKTSSGLTLALMLLLFMHWTCTRKPVCAPERTTLDSTLSLPASTVSLPVFYPVKELERIANEKLGDRIVEAGMAINEKEDSLYLTVSRFQPLRIAYDGERGIVYSIPVEISGFIHFRVIGISIRNKTPIHTRIVITMKSDLYLDEQWNLAPQTQLQGIEWLEDPKINVAGIKFNLKGIVEKILEKHHEEVIAKLDASAGELLKLRQSVEKVWTDIQKPISINRVLVPVWLKVEPDALAGRFLMHSEDTLMIEAAITATLRTVFDSLAEVRNLTELPAFIRKENDFSGLDAYLKVDLPFRRLNRVLNQITDTMRFTSNNKEVRIRSSEVYGTDQGLAIHISLRGDVAAEVYLTGTIGFDTLSREITIENFGLDVDSRQALVQAAAWLTRDHIVERLQPHLKVPVDTVFNALPGVITKAIEKGKLGSKIDLHLPELHVDIFQHLVTRKDIQIIFHVRGEAQVQLQRGLFEKKKPV